MAAAAALSILAAEGSPLPAGQSLPVWMRASSPSPRLRCLGFKRDTEAAQRLLRGAPVLPRPLAGPESHRVAVLRVEFEPDSDASTTGNGTFGNLTFYQPHPDTALAKAGVVVPDYSIDSRSRFYYWRHLQWMAQYWEAVSQGLFTLENFSQASDTLTDISPIIRLPTPMRRYGYDGQDDDTFARNQTEFVRDAVRSADTLTALDFSEYDAVLVFHAGAGQESDFGPPPAYAGDSPDDLHSSFVPFEALRFYLADDDPDFPGIPTVDAAGDTDYVREAAVLPETEIQDIPYNPSAAYLDILGVMCHEYGHRLGVPDLNDTDTPTRPAVGNFSLMASGLFNSSARLPAHPEAWSKLFLGWVEVARVTRDSVGIILKAIEQAPTPGAARLVQVPITSSEYFLLENRVRDSDFSGDFAFDDADGDNWPDLATDNYTLPGGRFTEFDFGLPGIITTNPQTRKPYNNPELGSGVLVWHVDEEVIRRTFDPAFEKNCVNCDVLLQGLDLEEADGVQHLDAVLPATIDPGFGSPFDSYGGGVPGIKEEGLNKLRTLFGPTTVPSSASNWGVPGEVTISGFLSAGIHPDSARVDSLLTLQVSFQQRIAGWPARAWEYTTFDFSMNPSVFGGSSIAVGPLGITAGLGVGAGRRDGGVFLWGPDGRELRTGTHEVVPTVMLGDSLSGSLSWGDITGDGRPEAVAATTGGMVYALAAGGAGEPGSVLPGFPVPLGQRIGAGPALADLDGDGAREIVVGTRSGEDSSRVVAIGGDGAIRWERKFEGEASGALALGSLRPGEAPSILVGVLGPVLPAIPERMGELLCLAADGTVRWSRTLGMGDKVTSLGLADLDRDGDADGDGKAESPGDLEIVAATINGLIYVFSPTGIARVEGPQVTGGSLRAPIALGDIDADGWVDVVALVEELRQVQAYRLASGGGALLQVKYFPKGVASSSGSGIPPFFSPPILGDLDADSAQEILFGTRDGLVLAYDASSSRSPRERWVLGAPELGAPALCDLDGDSTLDLVASDERGEVHAWGLGVPMAGRRLAWPQQGAGPERAAADTLPLLDAAPGGGAFSQENFYVFPNPAPGVGTGRADATIRYELDADVFRAAIEIFTISGRRVTTLPGKTAAGTQEVRWSLAEVPSGVYLVRLSVERPGGRRESLLTKAAVVR